MSLRSARFAGDPVLNECLAGRHRVQAGEEGLHVMRVQQALLDLGRDVGPSGADGIFGPDTGVAVTTYKTVKGLIPNDPVVGPGTARALDDDLFFDPPYLDPTFAEFSPFVVAHRIEPFAALELSEMLQAPLDSWRHMLGRFALSGLTSELLLGIVAQSRAIDLRDRFLAVADLEQGSKSKDEFFDDEILADSAIARMIKFSSGGQLRAFIVIRDKVILGREVIVLHSDGTRAPVTLQGVLVHELTHVRNLAGSQALLATADTDTNAYADPALAQSLSAAVGPTVEVLDSFIAEIVARHVHWVVMQELAGTPGTLAVRGLPADRLAMAALFYFVEAPHIYDSNGYGREINKQGDAMRFAQLDLWLRLCAAQSFSDIEAENIQSRLLFQAAAQFCADQVANPTLEFSQAEGLVPLPQDFH